MKPLELRSIIVDDEAPAREQLQERLLAHPNVQVVGEASSVATAVALCADLRPNLVFLDVQLWDGDGFSVLPRLDPLPAVIFVTAYDQYAVRAFEINAIDYLLKPVRPDRLAHALERIIRQPQPTHTEALLEDDRIFLRSDTRMRVVIVTEISGIEAQENYSLVRLFDGTSTLMRKPMSEWERGLPATRFLKPHRSLIVNREAVRKIVMQERDEITVELAGFPEPVRLGRRAALRLRRALREPNLL